MSELEANATAMAADAADVDLIRRYVSDGDRDAMGELFRRHADGAYRTALRVMRNAGEAEDAVQAAFVAVMRGAGSYRGGEGVRVWITKIVIGTCKNMIQREVRRRAREERAEEFGRETVDGEEAKSDAGIQVLTALEALPEKYRMPIWLHHHEGLGFRDVALAMGIPEPTVRSQAARGLVMLRDRLGRTEAPMMSILALVEGLPAEKASAGLIEGLGDIAGGLADLSKYVAGIKTTVVSGMNLWVKAGAILAGVVVAGGIATTVIRSVGTRAPGPMLFSEDFEKGLSRWIPVTGTWTVAKGKGAGGGDCLQVEQAGREYALIWADILPEQESFAVDFKVFIPTDQEVWLGLMFGPDDAASQDGYSHALWHSIGHMEDMGFKKGKWRQYHCVIRPDRFEYMVQADGRIIEEKSYANTFHPRRRPGIQASWFGKEGSFLYFDDFVVKRLEE